MTSDRYRVVGEWIAMGGLIGAEKATEIIKRHSFRLPPFMRDDFADLVAIEWFEYLSHGAPPEPEKLIGRIADKVRHRLIREAIRIRKSSSVTPVEDVASADNASHQIREHKEVVDAITKRLDIRQATVVKLLDEGYSRHQIADALGVTKRSIDRWIFEIREILLDDDNIR